MSLGQVSYWSRSPALPTGAGLLALIALPLWAVCTLRAKDATEAIFTDVGLQVDWVSHTTRSVMVMVAVVTPLVAAVVAANILLAYKWQRSGTRAPGTGTATYPKVLAQAMIVTDWLLLLAVAFTMSGMVTWLWDMVQANSALGGDPVLPGLEESGDYAAAAGLGVWPLPDFGAKTHTVVVHLLPAMVGIVAVFCAVSWLLMYQVATWVRAQCMAEQATAAQGNGLDAPLLNTSISLA